MCKKFGIFIAITIALAAGTLAFLERPFSNRMSAYVTDLSARTPEQRHNILRAAAALENLVLKPGEKFSFNEVAGPYTVERGYLSERSFRGRETVFTPGGGVCQVASTLFNAAQAAGLDILERIPHSQTVYSVPPGRDATVAYGVADLKFSNRHPFPVKLKAKAHLSQLLIEIWGKESDDDQPL